MFRRVALVLVLASGLVAVPAASPAPAVVLPGDPASGPRAFARTDEPRPRRIQEPPLGGRLALTKIGEFPVPTDIDAPPGDRRRLFVVQQVGLVRLLVDGELQQAPFLDLREEVRADGEAGLLSIAFAPDYASSGRFYVYLNDLAGNIRLVEYRRSADDPERADQGSARVLLYQVKFAPNHNGGMLQFGPDGLLYVAVGDGGASTDVKPGAFAQSSESIFGKILRVDATTGAYEIWVRGVRNPWRFWIDGVTGDTFVADVGQERREEVDVVPAGSSGANLGWPCFEGTLPFDESAGCEGAVPPLHEYGHAPDACAITGGVVVRDRRLGELQGAYLFGDLCGTAIRALRTGAGAPTVEELGVRVAAPVSFGVDARRRVFVGTAGGAVYRLDPAR